MDYFCYGHMSYDTRTTMISIDQKPTIKLYRVLLDVGRTSD